MCQLSIVSPVYKSQPLVDELVNRIRSAAEELVDTHEVILVDDRSPDDSWTKIVDNCNRYPNVKGIRLSRNSGQQHAMQAGLDMTSGQYVITMDCDLQDMPEEMYKLYHKALEGYDIVQARRIDRKDSFVKKVLSKSFYKVLGYLTETDQDNSVANFTCYSRRVLEAIASIKDNKRYYPMLIQWVGFNTVKVDILHASRPEGGSSYSIKRRLQLAFDTIIIFSDKPLRIAVKLGVLTSFFAITGALTLLALYFTRDIIVEGWASLSILLTFFSGVIIALLGLVGLYVGQTYESVKQRPTYIIQDKLNF